MDRIAKAEQAKKAAEQQSKKLKSEQEKMIQARLEAERKTAVKKLTEAVNAERAKGYAERLKLTEQLGDLRLKLERRDSPAGQIGEEGEADALAILTERFGPEGDELSRTKKFTRGGDIEHRIANGAGLLLYEVKSHRQYQNKWVVKAKENQLEAQADHVVIVTSAFPAGHRELMVSDDGVGPVLVVSPERLLAVATWLRSHTIRTHSLKLSNQQRLDKASRLYAFMCSDRVADRWDRMARTAERLRSALRSERLSHEKAWSDRTDQIDIIDAIRKIFVEDLDAIFEATDQCGAS